MTDITIEVREGKTVAGSAYNIPGKPIWRATTFVGRHIVDQNESRISEADAVRKSENRAERWGADWLRIYA